MMENFIYLILAILGLGFLIFIHELGHYVVARKVGMTVETFSIGMGKPIYFWTFQGVKWQIGCLPFGGFVKIAGTEKKGSLEPHQIPDGFYGRGPWRRIAVAIAGPLANIIFAAAAFTAIWLCGGQQKPFSATTNVIGDVEPPSKLYSQGIRPGDQITGVNGKNVQGLQDVMMAVLLSDRAKELKGVEIDYGTGKKEPFALPLDPALSGIEAVQSIAYRPAQYLVFSDFLSPESPMRESGIEKGDRITWVNGSFIFSREQLSRVLNEPKTLLTIERDGATFLRSAPRLKVSDLRLDDAQKQELGDWQHEAGLKTKLSQLYFIPYNLSNEAVVEEPISYLDNNSEETAPSLEARRPLDAPLQKGDRIVAVDGFPIASSFDLLSHLQSRHALVIVQRGPPPSVPEWKDADKIFESSFSGPAIETISSKIGTAAPVGRQSDNTVLLKPVALKSLHELALDPKTEAAAKSRYEQQKKEIGKIDNPKQRDAMLRVLEEQQKQLVLGVQISDRAVVYNPTPFVQFTDACGQMWRTLANLAVGNVSPKSFAGPIGIVQVLQGSWESGFKDALYWLGFVSLNLAFLNLLPIPVLDGGHILFSVIEGVTKRPIKPKTLEKLILPFMILLVGFLIYLTYHDLLRIFT